MTSSMDRGWKYSITKAHIRAILSMDLSMIKDYILMTKEIFTKAYGN